ncbi:MAG: PKD domain-containing protein [Actinomycetes bacterium]
MRTRGRFLGVALVAVTVSAGLVVPATVAGAAPADEGLVSANPQNNTPRVLDGRVQAIKRVGDTVIVGGTFTQVQEAAPNSSILSRSGLFSFDANTGVVSSTFVPVLSKKPGQAPGVNALIVAPDNQSVYVGGDYRNINGGGPARVQRLSLSDGTRVSSFGNGAFNSKVFDLALVGDRLYVAGSFKSVGGVSRKGLATLDASTGDLTDAVNLPFTGTAGGSGVTTVRKIDLTPSGDRLVAIGNFSAVNATSRMQVAMLNTGGPSATVDGWNTTRFGGLDCSGFFDTYTRDVDIAPDGSFFVVVTTGGFGGSTGTKLCDSASRWETYGSGSQQPTWVDYSGGDTFWAVEVTGPVAYVGGHFRWMNNLLSKGDAEGPGGISREGLAALDTRNGLPFSWNPTRTRGVGVFDFHVTNTELWAGSDTSIWAGERRDRLAAFPWDGGLPLPSDRLGALPGDVVQLDTDAVGGVDVSSRYLTGASAPVVTPLASGGIDWSKLRGAFMVNDTLYTGWSDGTLKQQAFDGNTFGPLSTVEMNSNTFAGELAATTRPVTSMFYDRRTGRLYYTRKDSTGKQGQSNNDGGLYSRAFTPESRALGDVSSSTLRDASRTAIDASTIRGAFLTGDQLHYVNAAGNLRQIQFSSTGFVGSSILVNNAIDWRAKGLFLSTQPSVQAPNNSPTAAFTQTCVGLSCSFDGTSSTDADGTVVSYSWDFGDGSTVVAGAKPNYNFVAGNSYPVTLTVTDNDGSSNSITTNVVVAPIASSVAFRDAASYQGKQLRFHKWDLPSSIQAGDTVVMAVSGFNTADPGLILDVDKAPIAGWSVIGDVSDTDARTVLYAKTASAGDAGSKVAVQYTDGANPVNTVSTKAVVSIGVYSGVASVGPVLTAPEDASRRRYDHTTPGVSNVANGDWVLSYWSDKTSGTTAWEAPAGQVERVDTTSYVDPASPTSVRMSALLTDDGAPTVAGGRAGLTATASDRSLTAMMATIVLRTN